MRLLALLALASALAGCAEASCKLRNGPGADCSYGAGPVTMEALFLDEAWDSALAADALRGMGLDPRAEGDAVRARSDDAEVEARRVQNGTIAFTMRFPPAGGPFGSTQEEARRAMDATHAAALPRGEATLAAFERATGWTSDAVRWLESVSVA